MVEILTAQTEPVEATLAKNAKQNPSEMASEEPAKLGQPIDEPLAIQAPSDWSESLRKAVRSGQKLLDLLELPSDLASPDAETDFPVFVPWEYIRRMEPKNPEDPLLRQVLGVPDEVHHLATGKLDPVGDKASEIVPGLLRKYDRRALLITTGACAVHCRYCFRRHFPYEQAPTSPSGWQPAIDAIALDKSLDEVILSGGDPLSVRDQSLQWLVDTLGAIPRIKRIRLHTRFPVMIPHRVCQSLLNWVSGARCAIYFVLHFNHAAEIDADVLEAMRKLRLAGATLLNQSVLLKGINDSAETQIELCSRLVDSQILPYYLHQLDPVQGGMHFEVPDERATEIIAEMRRSLPGYGVPSLVRELAGYPHKVPVESDSNQKLTRP